MRETMRLLIALQDCDNRIRETEDRRNKCPVKMLSLEEGVKEAEVALNQSKERLEALKRERREVEREIDDLEAKKKKSQAKLSTVSTNKEYRAALKEIEELDRAKRLLEDKALELMDQLERFEEQIKSSDKGLQALKHKTSEEKKVIESEMKELDAEISRLVQEREELCKQIDRDLLSKYDMLRERRGGVAVSPVISGVCQTCHMGIPPQKFNELIRGDALMSCPNCQRIIYWGEDEKLKAVSNSGNDES